MMDVGERGSKWWTRRGRQSVCTFFLNCLWIASSASLIVTPFEFRAVTSRPSGKCRSILLTGGLTRCSLRMSLSSTVDGDVLSFLDGRLVSGVVLQGWAC